MEQLEKLFQFGSFDTPRYAMHPTGDEVPAWVYAALGCGLLAVIAFIALDRRKWRR